MQRLAEEIGKEDGCIVQAHLLEGEAEAERGRAEQPVPVQDQSAAGDCQTEHHAVVPVPNEHSALRQRPRPPGAAGLDRAVLKVAVVDQQQRRLEQERAEKGGLDGGPRTAGRSLVSRSGCKGGGIAVPARGWPAGPVAAGAR